MKEIFGERIDYIYMCKDKRYLCFIAGISCTSWVYEVEGDSCSHAWFESINNPQNIIDEKIIGIEEKVRKKRKYKYAEYIDIHRYTLKTIKGYTDIEFVNTTIGSYGASCDFIEDAIIDFGTPFSHERMNILKEKKTLLLILYKDSSYENTIKILPYKKD